MFEYAAFLRGINLGPHRRISAAELRSIFQTVGFEDVATFRASGNVVFGGASGGRLAPGKLTARIETALANSLGWEVEVFLRSASEVRAMANYEPFSPRMVTASNGKLQVAMCAGRPSPATRKAVLALATDADRLAFGERELYWLPSGGTMESALDLKTIAKLLGSTTMRTKGTVEQLAAKFFAG